MRLLVCFFALLPIAHASWADEINAERFNLTRPARQEANRPRATRTAQNRADPFENEDPEPRTTGKTTEPTSQPVTSQIPSSKADSTRDPSVQHHGVEASRARRGAHKRNATEEAEEENKEALTLRKVDPVGVATMFVVGLITTSLNFVSCGYLLYLVWTLSFKVGFHSSLRLLAYSTLFDMLVGSFFTLSIVYSTLFDSLIAGVGCQAIGFVINMLTASDMILIGFVAISTYYKVVHNYEVPRGKFDCWLLLGVLGVPLLASAILANFHAFGPEALWCLIDDETLAGKISTAGTVSLYFFVMMLVLVCYALVRKNSKAPTLQNSSIKSHNYSDNFDSLEHPSKEKEFKNRYYRKSVLSLGYAEMKLETHLIIHFFQYTPPTLHLLAMFSGYRTAWVFTLAILSTNLGGLFQLWAYLHHQKKKRSHFKAYYQPPSSSSINTPSTIQFNLPQSAHSSKTSSKLRATISSFPTRSPLRNSSFKMDDKPNHFLVNGSSLSQIFPPPSQSQSHPTNP